MFKKTLAAILISGSLLLACSLKQAPVVTSNDVAAIINLVSAFNGWNGQLTVQQMAAIQDYLSTTTKPDVMILIQMLASYGVLPTDKFLTSTQLAAILGLLDVLGFHPVISGTAPTASQLAPARNMQYKY